MARLSAIVRFARSTWPLNFLGLALLGLTAQGCTKQPAAQAGGSHVSPSVASAAVGLSGYRRLTTIHLGGEGRWDALAFDANSRRLFISRETHVMVLDVDNRKVVGDVPDTPGVHAVAIASELNRGFTSNGRAGTVTIFDLTTLGLVGRVAAGDNPDAIVYEPVSRHVLAMNGRSHDATVIEAKTGGVITTIPLGGKPEFAAPDGAGHVYVNLEDESEMLEIDTRKQSVTARWPLSPCEGPSGIAMDTAHRRLFAACANKVMVVVNADTGQLVATLPIGAGVDGAGFDPGTALAFSSNGEGTLSVVREDSADSYTLLESIPTQRGARTMAVDPARHQVFLVTADFGPTPSPTQDDPRPRPPLVPDSFVVLVVGR
jgi:YVTN family beta-propeller protein